jgi:hypothetical protein
MIVFRRYQGIVALFVLFGIGGAVWYFRVLNAYANPVGVLRTERNAELEANIDTFMETATNTPLTQGRENYRCSNLLYGYDDRYAYAWVFCAGYSTGEELKVTLESASSIPTRLEYSQGTYDIVAFEQPKDGNLYEPTLKKLFPKIIFSYSHPTNEEIAVLEAKTLQKAEAYVIPIELSSFGGDFNNDGIFDQVTLRISDAPELGKSATLRIEDSVMVIPGTNIQGITSVDVNIADGMQEIAIADAGPSSDPTTSFYAYDGTTIFFMGTVPGINDQITYDGNGGITTISRGSILDTWFYRDTFSVNDDHKIVRIPQEFYERIKPSASVTMLADLALQQSPINHATAITLHKGDVVKIAGCDNIKWCKVETSQGTTGWFAVEDFNIIPGVGEARMIFDGLSNAD